jgi:threonylcarbamoyladenosine tRNA methylthiotransferase CDKAL1
MENILKKDGFKVVGTPEGADVAIINSCTVKNSAEQKMFSEADKLKKIVPHIILAGCVPQGEKNKNRFKDFSILGVDNLKDVSNIVRSVIGGNILEISDSNDDDTLEINKRFNNAIEIVPIAKGCLGACTYCKTKHARGNLHSYDKDKILKSIRSALDSGAREIWLTSQDCGAYGLDNIKSDNKSNNKNNTNNNANNSETITSETIVSLLDFILDNTSDYKEKGISFRIRLGMSNPDFMTRYIDDLIRIFKDERMFRFLHIPVQSGNDRILKLMGRRYKRADFEKIIHAFRKNFEDFTFSTDIIVGFPTEKESEFSDSYDVVEKNNISVLNMSKFWPRPGTVASDMELLDDSIVKKRIERLKDLHYRLTKNYLKRFDSTIQTVIIDELEDDQIIAHTDSYVKVILDKRSISEKIKKDFEKLSIFAKIKVTKTNQWDLTGKLILDD